MMILSALTDEELKHLFAKADLEVRQAGSWGPAMQKAEREYEALREEIERRRNG